MCRHDLPAAAAKLAHPSVVVEEVGVRGRHAVLPATRKFFLRSVGAQHFQLAAYTVRPVHTRLLKSGRCGGWPRLSGQSAGKRKSGKTRKGNVWLRAALIEAAHSLGRGRGTYLSAQYRRLTARRGKKKAAVALGHAIPVIVYHLLSRGNEVYQDLGVNYFDESRRQRIERGLVHRLEDLGYEVTLQPAHANAPVADAAPSSFSQHLSADGESTWSVGGLSPPRRARLSEMWCRT
jgi:hypothetical protein